MPAVIPTPWYHVPDDAQIIDDNGLVVTVGPWLLAQPGAGPLVRIVAGVPRPITMAEVVPLLVPSERDALATLRNYFTIEEIPNA